MPRPASDALKQAICEADTMKRIAQLLDALPDDASRNRVLQWSIEHFHGAHSVSLPATDDRQRPAGPTAGGQSDPALMIGDDIFETPRTSGEGEHDHDRLVDDEPGDETIHFEDLAVEGVVFEREEIDTDDLAIEEADVNAPARDARPAGGLESTLRDFVAAFQKLAVAWQTA